MKRAGGVADFYADFVPLPSLSDLFYVNKRVLSKIFKPYLKMLWFWFFAYNTGT